MHEDRSLPFLVRNANKSRTEISRPQEILEIASGADILLLGRDTGIDLDPAAVRERHPHLVVVHSSPFGLTGPRAHWQATDNTLLALSGALSRSGRPGAVPLLPPAGIASATAAAHVAWTALVALIDRARNGSGQLVDLAHTEAVAVGLDPAYGAQGSAAAGRSGAIRRDRPPADSYPIYPCADGSVRLCLLAPRQWKGMFEWLGSPPEFSDPKFASIAARVAAADHLDPLIAELFAHSTGAELVEEAARRGVPLARVLSLGEAIASDHFVDAGTVERVELAPGLSPDLPLGFADINGERLGFRTACAETAVDQPAWQERSPLPEQPAGDLPFSGLRVLDLGVIVFGAEIGRALADMGADVIKVESLAFPDGLRQTRGGEPMNASFAWGQRNKRSLGLDLRSPAGLALFQDLVRHSDVVLTNFKPGTLTSLGIDHGTLSAINPGVIVVESAAFSSRGPWARRLGYGPLVRAACGISSLWKYAADDTECWDGVTVYPDHVAARIGALTVAATILGRMRTGIGARVEVAQSDVVLHQLAPAAASESLAPGSVTAVGNRDRHGFGDLFSCLGEDEWCVIEARTAVEEERLRAVVGADPVDDLRLAVATWVGHRTPEEAMERLQEVGIPAAAMRRLDQISSDPQLLHRHTYRTMKHPALEHELPTEDAGVPFGAAGSTPLAPAPLVGQHTREVLSEVLGLASDRIDALLAAGTVHEGTATARDADRPR